MSRPIVRVIDISTGETSDREMNDQEYEQHLIDVANAQAELAVKEVAE